MTHLITGIIADRSHYIFFVVVLSHIGRVRGGGRSNRAYHTGGHVSLFTCVRPLPTVETFPHETIKSPLNLGSVAKILI